MTTVERDREIAKTIRSQVPFLIFACLGASNFHYVENGLEFDARILPFRKDGKRGVRPRKMTVEIVLNGWDYYDVLVWYMDRGKIVQHYAELDLDFEQLPRVLLALDFDGPTALNPRYV